MEEDNCGSISNRKSTESHSEAIQGTFWCILSLFHQILIERERERGELSAFGVSSRSGQRGKDPNRGGGEWEGGRDIGCG